MRNGLLRSLLPIMLAARAIAATDEERVTCYPAARTYRHGAITVEVMQWAKDAESLRNPLYFKEGASITIRRGNRLIQKISFGQQESNGGLAGLFVPVTQPSERYFSVVKFGNYDGRHFLFDRTGAVLDLPGGVFFKSSVGRRNLLFTLQARDGQGPLTIFDLAAGKTLASLRVPLDITKVFLHRDQLYLKGVRYVGLRVTEQEGWVRIGADGKRLLENPPLPDQRMTELPMVDGYEVLGL